MSESIIPNLGDVCRLRDQPGLWVPYHSNGSKLDVDEVRHHRWRFAAYPEHNSLRTLPLTDVLEVVHKAGSKESRDFQRRHNMGPT